MTKRTETGDYGPEALEVLKTMEPPRKRPDHHVGDTDPVPPKPDKPKKPK